MKLFERREIKGAVSILLVMIMLPMMVLSAFMVDTARYNLAKSMVSSAGDLAVNAALADYDTILKDVYGLFAMSQSDTELKENTKEYFKDTLVGYGVVDESEAEDYVSSLLGSIYEYFVIEDKEAADFMRMKVEDTGVTVSAVEESGLNNPDILEKQIVEYMKYRGPVDFGLSFLDSLSAFTKIESQSDVIQKQVEAQESMGPVAEAGEKAYKAAAAYDALYNTLQPDPLPADGMYLTNYGRRLLTYRDRYREISRITILYCVTNFASKWEIMDEDLRVLNWGGDWIDGGITSHLPGASSVSYSGMEADAAKSAVDVLRDDVNEAGITDYGDARKFVHGTDESYLSVLADFQAADRYYREKREDFLSACLSLDQYSAGVDAFEALITEKVNEKEEEKEELESDLDDLEEELVELNGKAALTIGETARKKEIVEEEIPDLESEIADVNDEITVLKTFWDMAKNDYDGILSACGPAANAYNSDVKAYRSYVAARQSAVDLEAGSIALEFDQITTNLGDLSARLNELGTALGEVRTKVEAYMGKVGEWEEKNNHYLSDSGEDNFSEHNTAEITEAKNTFDLAEIDELIAMAAVEKARIDSCIAEIGADGNFTYCGKSIADIYYSNDMRSALFDCGSGDELKAYAGTAAPDVDDADMYFDYKGEIADPEHFLTDLKKLMEPYPCCKYMNYLYQTYKKDIDNYNASGENKEKADQYKGNYEKLKGGENKVEPDLESTADDTYHYSYAGKTIGGEGYPSSGESADKEVTSDKKEDSSGLDANKKAAKGLLEGLADAMETGRDKLFVMGYLFDNFSYNTIVQDLAREGGKEPSWINKGAGVYADYIDKPATGSLVPINEKNNYLYGAEIEYILFGNKDAKKNVTGVKAGIFAIRFLFNAVYAFTDSEVRNETRLVALAVQAASLGIIPYQLVQVVLQLALAMGESAVDLMNMDAGAKVALVKSRDTWTMSINGMVNLAAEKLKAVAEGAADAALKKINNTISQVVDAGVDKLKDTVANIEEDLSVCVDSAAEEVLNSLQMKIEVAVDAAMSKAMYFSEDMLGTDPGTARNVIETNVGSAFDKARESVKSVLDSAEGESEIGRVLSEQIRSYIDKYLEAVQVEVNGQIGSFPTVEGVRGYIFEKLAGVKEGVLGKFKEKKDDDLKKVKEAFEGKVNDAAAKIKETAEEKSEAARAKILEEVNGFVDDISQKSTKFISDALPDTSLTKANKNAVGSSSKASIIKFGYSDYLRLFVFIGLCASDKSGAMLKRTADVIQANISHAGEGSDLKHASGEAFSMVNAKTYVSLEADVELEMMFLKLGVFQRQVEEYNRELEDDRKMDLSTNLKVRYIGIGGY